MCLSSVKYVCPNLKVDNLKDPLPNKKNHVFELSVDYLILNLMCVFLFRINLHQNIIEKIYLNKKYILVKNIANDIFFLIVVWIYLTL